MEWKKAQAVRSREMAERMFLQNDFYGAKEFALKAQQLFPDLEGLPQLIAVLDVYIIAQDKVNGVEDNWYGILQIDPTADDATIKKQYRKLALILHPDKNKAVGAEGAFKILSEAWGVLSDKLKKAVHDAKRRATLYHCVSASNKGKGVSESAKGFYKFACFTASHRSKPANRKSPSFWTACSFCKVQIEILRVYENHMLSCQTCHEPFLATEVPMPGGSASRHPNFTMGSGFFHRHFFMNRVRSSSFPGINFPWGAFRNPAADHGAAAAAIAEMVQQTYETVKRNRVASEKEAHDKWRKESYEVHNEVRKKYHREGHHKRRKTELDKEANAAALANKTSGVVRSRSFEGSMSPEHLATRHNLESKSTSSVQPKETIDALEFVPIPERYEHVGTEKVLTSEPISVQVPGHSKSTCHVYMRCKRKASVESTCSRDTEYACYKRSRPDVQEPSCAEKDHCVSVD